MLREIDKKIIQELSEKYNVKYVFLFGSSLDDTKESQDIDIAVEGIKSTDFFKYYGDLMLNLSNPVDLIDLSTKSKFNDLIKVEGEIIYG